MDSLKNLMVEVFDEGRQVFSTPLADRIEIGRQRVNELAPYQINRAVVPQRLIIAPVTELEISRSHALLEVSGDRVRVTNVSSQSHIEFVGSGDDMPERLKPGESWEGVPPFSFLLGRRVIKVRSVHARLLGLNQMTMPPSIAGQSMGLTMSAPSIVQLRTQHAMDVTELMNWLRNVLALFQGTPNTDEFYQQATQAMAQMLELDSAAVLFRENDAWQVRWVHHETPHESNEHWEPSLTILNEVYRSVRAHRQVPSIEDEQPESLMGVRSLVAAPILSPEGQVIGALYGDKRIGGGRGRDISEIETMFVELLASGIAAGLARLEQEKRVVQARVRFEQFFPAKLAERLENDQEFLKGRESDVTVLFCDIRKFSNIAERVGPDVTVEFINNVMDELSLCVQEHEGVLVDYVGDELIAMWGAPDDQPEHPGMAVAAAQAMLQRVPVLGSRWNEKIGTDFQLGIGVNSGIAKVGNIGSNLRFKYGPLGNTVNVASRVQGVTKWLRVPLLVTLETARRLPEQFDFRRICKVKLFNVSQPVSVCEVGDPNDEQWLALKAAYEQGLALFEQGQWLEACNVLSAVLKTYPNDTPTMNLLSRAVGFLSGTGPTTDADVWVLDSK